MKQNQHQAPDRNLGERDSVDRKTPQRPLAERTFAGNRPNAAQEGGLLRELKETPRHLD